MSSHVILRSRHGVYSQLTFMSSSAEKSTHVVPLLGIEVLHLPSTHCGFEVEFEAGTIEA